MKQIFLRFAVVFAVLVLVIGCSDPELEEPVTFISVFADGSETENTTKLVLTFDKDITELSAADITLTPAISINKGSLNRTDTGVYELQVNGSEFEVEVEVTVSKSGYFITGGPIKVDIFTPVEPEVVTFISVSADGSVTENTTKLVLTFNKDITELSAADITLTPANGINKGSLNRTNTGVYELQVSGSEPKVEVEVSVSKSGYFITGGPKRVDIFSPLYVWSSADSGPGSLRQAIADAGPGSVISIGVETIYLTSRLLISGKNIVIEGNGVTITRSPAWTNIGESTQLLRVENSSTVRISRIHFKDGRANTNGAAIQKTGNNTLILESCIFSGNHTNASNAMGGVIHNLGGFLTIRGCTFYNNSTNGEGGVIYISSGTVNLTGNLFYGNTAGTAPVVFGWIVSGGYNVVDVPLGTGNTQSGWNAGTGDKTISNWPVSPQTFQLLPESDVANVITTLPASYPTVDFYGNPITNSAAAGAVQSTASGTGYYLDLTVNDTTFGSVEISLLPNNGGRYSGSSSITLTATPANTFGLSHWLVNGEEKIDNPLLIIMTNHTRVQAVFERTSTATINVTSQSDAANSQTTPGTLRYALANALDGDTINISLTAPNNVIELTSRLTISGKNIVIEGNGATLTRSPDWTNIASNTQLLRVTSSTVHINRIHFKDGKATTEGAAIQNASQSNLTLESCIFSGNHTDASNATGGVIYSSTSTLTIKGCTFFNNSTNGSIGVIRGGGAVVLTGNLFYENTAVSGNPIVTSAASGGYNVVDVPLGTASNQSGWNAATGDTTFSALDITGVPFNTSTFVPVVELRNIMPVYLDGFPATDFYGTPRTSRTPGAVN